MKGGAMKNTSSLKKKTCPSHGAKYSFHGGAGAKKKEKEKEVI